MLSTFGFDSKGASRNGSRFLPSAPRGLSVHVFKNSALPTHSAPAPPVVAPSKYDPVPTRPSTGGGQWNRQLSYHPSPNDSERKQTSAAPPSQEHRLVHIPTTSQPWPVEMKHSKSQKSYGIYPSLTSDIYIYERSISSVSLDDDLTHSPSSDSSSSDSDLLYDTATHANLEISSTRASSSTETLESTLTPRTFPNASSSLPPARPAITAPPRPASTRPPPLAENSAALSRSAVPLTRADSHVQRNIPIAHTTVPPIQLASAPLDNLSDSDSDTVISDSHANDMVVDMLGAHWTGPMSYPYPGRSSTPFHRESDGRTAVSSSTYRRNAPASSVPVSRDARDPPASRPSAPLQYHPRADSPRGEDAAHPRAPPGLSGAVATSPDGSPREPRGSANAPPALSSRSLTSAPPLARSPSSRPGPAGSPPGPRARNADMGSSSHLPPSSQSTPPSASAAANAYVSSSPPRHDARMSSSPQQIPPMKSGSAPNGTPSSAAPHAAQVQTSSPHSSPTAAGMAGALVVASVAKRNVRWTENLVCPSPVPPESRRKGWYNRRGDQLWTNDGQYKLAEPGEEYPLDLNHYPEPNTGWMNEEGVRIDMQHRLIPKPPLRSALKRPKPVNGNV